MQNNPQEEKREELCRCGHEKESHTSGIGGCQVETARDWFCNCQKFIPSQSEGKKEEVKHRKYCAKSGMSCLVIHYDGKGNRTSCPHVTDCEGCKKEAPSEGITNKDENE